MKNKKTVQYVLIALLTISVILNAWLIYQMYVVGLFPPSNAPFS